MSNSNQNIVPVSIVIPAYNEEKRLPPFLTTMVQYMQLHPGDIGEVILVDDGSTDGTVHNLQSFTNLPPLRVIQHVKNKGKGAAVKTGVMNAHCNTVIFMDADGATGIDQLPKMIEALHRADIAVGNRWMSGSKTERHSILRKVSGYVYRKYMALFGLGDIDTMCGFKGYRKSVAIDLFESLMEHRWLFDTEIAYKARRKKYKILNFPIRWVSKDGSKLDMKTLLKSALKILPLILKIKSKERGIRNKEFGIRR